MSTDVHLLCVSRPTSHDLVPCLPTCTCSVSLDLLLMGLSLVFQCIQVMCIGSRITYDGLSCLLQLSNFAPRHTSRELFFSFLFFFFFSSFLFYQNTVRLFSGPRVPRGLSSCLPRCHLQTQIRLERMLLLIKQYTVYAHFRRKPFFLFSFSQGDEKTVKRE